MQELMNNLESIGINVPNGVKLIFLEKEKDQIANAFDNGIYAGVYAVDIDGQEYCKQEYTNEPTI